ncbi:MAG: hydantoinase/oxoprolinase family protein [Planctomycetota bacterium]
MVVPHRSLGLDIGGANLKAALANGVAKEIAFPLWSKPDELPDAISRLVELAPGHDSVAVTMTGELADCFETKAEGVAAIVRAVVSAASGKDVQFYTTEGTFVEATQAVEQWATVAAANWHALARALGKRSGADTESLVIDIGSTTTDIIPFSSAKGPMTCALSDTQRLLSGQLLYQGVSRTPLCALVTHLPFRGEQCPVAAEFFATTGDVSLLLHHTPESYARNTADNRPLIQPYAIARLGRMICADGTQFDYDDAVIAARFVADAMERNLVQAISKQWKSIERLERIVLSGCGEWLGRRALARLNLLPKAVSLADEIGRDAARCAPAWAVATLQDEWSRT